MMFLLDALTTVPAHVIDDLTNMQAQNPLSRALIGPWAELEGRDANVTWRWFTEPSSRALNTPEEHAEFARYWQDTHVQTLRSTPKTLLHPRAGRLEVQCDIVLSTTTGHRPDIDW
jgi:hypothetical protein